MENGQEVIENILRGLSSQIAEREDPLLCSDVRNKLFGPMEFSRRDLASLNIMRGRDNGLPDYNTVIFYSNTGFSAQIQISTFILNAIQAMYNI